MEGSGELPMYDWRTVALPETCLERVKKTVPQTRSEVKVYYRVEIKGKIVFLVESC